jgi:hypothetical protein
MDRQPCPAGEPQVRTPENVPQVTLPINLVASPGNSAPSDNSRCPSYPVLPG